MHDAAKIRVMRFGVKPNARRIAFLTKIERPSMCAESLRMRLQHPSRRRLAEASSCLHFCFMNNDFPEPQFITANGVRFAIYEADGDAARTNPPILLVHGWPEIAYSWRNQIHALADAGYRVIALDLKGFGRSDAPKDVALYDIEHITTDLAGVLSALNIERAVFCGHDWGGSIVWSMAQWRPERVAGVIGVCTPVKPRPPVPPISILKKRFTEKHYFVQFQEPDVMEALFETDIERFVKMMFQKPAPRERWASLVPRIYDLPGRFKNAKEPDTDSLLVSDDVIQVYIDAFQRSGFHGGVNLYRNVDRNWELMESRDETVRAPGLWIGADLDLFLPPESADGMEALVPDLEKHVIAGSGHWVMWEKPQDLNALVIDWLTRRIST
ncbi:Bifunctional epoxide hydrolase 2 [Includes: Cytosolic epoxide hydrolase 2 (CEH) (Epoxide hydratase) (Soluble epoxide hydrolase) (SEH) [Durusdinium trenchii]|uniref:Bifunctional epoxide hydrolase 2 n=1 Tax=Durusdinium trenchii TaxID=1381693 RepID=A0ABP0LRU3_9DINO